MASHLTISDRRSLFPPEWGNLKASRNLYNSSEGQLAACATSAFRNYQKGSPATTDTANNRPKRFKHIGKFRL
jgi:hypothetical protein